MTKVDTLSHDRAQGCSQWRSLGENYPLIKFQLIPSIGNLHFLLDKFSPTALYSVYFVVQTHFGLHNEHKTVKV